MNSIKIVIDEGHIVFTHTPSGYVIDEIKNLSIRSCITGGETTLVLETVAPLRPAKAETLATANLTANNESVTFPNGGNVSETSVVSEFDLSARCTIWGSKRIARNAIYENFADINIAIRSETSGGADVTMHTLHQLIEKMIITDTTLLEVDPTRSTIFTKDANYHNGVIKTVGYKHSGTNNDAVVTKLIETFLATLSEGGAFIEFTDLCLFIRDKSTNRVRRARALHDDIMPSVYDYYYLLIGHTVKNKRVVNIKPDQFVFYLVKVTFS